MSELSWDDEQIDVDENVSEQDIKEAESMGKVRVGKYLCEIVASEPKQKDFKEYSCVAANLKMEILKVLELDGAAVQGDEGDAYVGRAIFDDVALYNPSEKDGMRKRRILIAKRIGLIGESTDRITKSMWKNEIIGKKVVINYIEEVYIDKRTNTNKKSRKVAFDGYEDCSGIDIADNAPDINDI